MIQRDSLGAGASPQQVGPAPKMLLRPIPRIFGKELAIEAGQDILVGSGRHWTARRCSKHAHHHCVLDGLDGLDGSSSFQKKEFYRTGDARRRKHCAVCIAMDVGRSW